MHFWRFCLLTLDSYGQIWTLDDCIAYALEHNIEVKQQELTAESKRLTLSESKWAYAPDISASNSYNISSGRMLDPLLTTLSRTRPCRATTRPYQRA